MKHADTTTRPGSRNSAKTRTVLCSNTVSLPGTGTRACLAPLVTKARKVPHKRKPRIKPLDRALVRRAFELKGRRDRFLCVAKAAGLSELSALRLWSLVQ